MISPQDNLTKICSVCGNTFAKTSNISKDNWAKRNFCSRKCVNTGRKCPWAGKKLAWEVWNKGLIGVQVPWNKGITYNQIRGDKHYLWKGDKANLTSQHKWIVTRLGKPSKCDFCGDTTRKMYHWSNISGKYFRDINDYQRLCVPCHKRFDLDKLKNK